MKVRFFKNNFGLGIRNKNNSFLPGTQPYDAGVKRLENFLIRNNGSITTRPSIGSSVLGSISLFSPVKIVGSRSAAGVGKFELTYFANPRTQGFAPQSYGATIFNYDGTIITSQVLAPGGTWTISNFHNFDGKPYGFKSDKTAVGNQTLLICATTIKFPTPTVSAAKVIGLCLDIPTNTYFASLLKFNAGAGEDGFEWVVRWKGRIVGVVNAESALNANGDNTMVFLAKVDDSPLDTDASYGTGSAFKFFFSIPYAETITSVFPTEDILFIFTTRGEYQFYFTDGVPSSSTQAFGKISGFGSSGSIQTSNGLPILISSNKKRLYSYFQRQEFDARQVDVLFDLDFVSDNETEIIATANDVSHDYFAIKTLRRDKGVDNVVKWYFYNKKTQGVSEINITGCTILDITQAIPVTGVGASSFNAAASVALFIRNDGDGTLSIGQMTVDTIYPFKIGGDDVIGASAKACVPFMETLPIDIQTQEGGTTGFKKTINRVMTRYRDAFAVQMKIPGSDWIDVVTQEPSDPHDGSHFSKSGDRTISVNSKPSTVPTIQIQVLKNDNATIDAIVAEVDMEADLCDLLP